MDFSPAWRTIAHTAYAEFRAETFAAAAAFVAAVGEAADAADHHPEVALRYPGVVRIAVSSHDVGRLTARDERFAHAVDVLAERHGAQPLPPAVQMTTIAIDTTDPDRVRPFWQAAFAYRERRGALLDPAGIGPMIWFQHADEPRPQRNRIHLDVYVPVEQAETRVAEVLAVGGVLVTDRFAPSWWVLADVDGNEVCVCTSMEAPEGS